MVHVFLLGIGVSIRWYKSVGSSHQKWEFTSIVYTLGFLQLSTFCDRDIDKQYISRGTIYIYIYRNITPPTGLSLTWYGHGRIKCIQMSSWCFLYMSVNIAHKSPALSCSLFRERRKEGEKFLNHIIKKKKKKLD